MKIRSSLLQTILIASALTLAGCEVGPDYEKPETTVSQEWHAGDQQQNSVRADIDQEWWKNFNDPILTQLIDKAAADNLDLKIAEARIAEARATVDASTATALPSVNMKGTATRQANQLALPDENTLGPLGGIIKKPFNTFQTGFDASWEMDLFGGMQRVTEQAEATMQATEASRDDARVSLLAEVARTYIDIRGDQAQLDIAQQTIASNQKTLDIANERYKTGNAPRLDVTQAEAALEQSNTQIPHYSAQLAASEYSMDVLLGEQPGATQALITPSVSIPTVEKQIVLSAPASVITQRPDIRVAERKLAAATAQQGMAVAKFFPDISLNGFFGVLNTTTSNLISPTNKSWLASGSVIWPILNIGTLSANLDIADAQQQEALASYQKSVLGALSDVNKSLSNYNERQKFLAAAQSEADKDKHARDIAEERYKAGLTSYTDVLVADRVTYEAQTRLIDARASSSQDLVALYKSLGGGWATN